MSKCIGKDRHGSECRNLPMKDKTICKYHVHMEYYTPEMLAQLTRCSGCMKQFCFMHDEHPDRKSCDTCKQRSLAANAHRKSKIVKCAFESCKFKKSDKNEFCGKHQKQLLVLNAATRNKKMCVNYIRGCENELDVTDSFSRCGHCRKDACDVDNKRRKEAQDSRTVTESAVVSGKICCTVCLQNYDVDDFKPKKGDSLLTDCISDLRGRTESTKDTILKTCSKCRDRNKVQDAKRSREHVNELARTNSKKPEKIEGKRAWIEENRGQVSLYWMNSRGRQIGAGIEEYLARNAENARVSDRARSARSYRII